MLNREAKTVRLTKPHNHEADLRLLSRLTIRNKILQETLRTPFTPLKEVYKNATLGEDGADLKELNLDFSSIARWVACHSFIYLFSSLSVNFVLCYRTMKRLRNGDYPTNSGSKVPEKKRRPRTKKQANLSTDPDMPDGFDKDVFEAEECDVKEEIHNGDEYEEIFDREEEDEALHRRRLSHEEMDNLQPADVAVGHDGGIVTSSQTPNPLLSFGVEADARKPDNSATLIAASETAIIKDASGHQRDDAEARFGRYLAEKMRMVPRERQFDAEFAVLSAMREFIPR